MQSGWNLWSQGSTRRSWPFSKSSVQMEQPRFESLLVVRSVLVAAPTPVASVSAGAMPDGLSTVMGGVSVVVVVVVAVAAVGAGALFAVFVSAVSWAGGTLVVVPSTSLVSAVDASSTSVGFAGSFSPNLTIGIVSRIALPRPLALLCLGRPITFRGPYRSG